MIYHTEKKHNFKIIEYANDMNLHNVSVRNLNFNSIIKCNIINLEWAIYTNLLSMGLHQSVIPDDLMCR